MILPLRYEDMSYNHTEFWPYGAQGGEHPHDHPGDEGALEIRHEELACL